MELQGSHGHSYAPIIDGDSAVTHRDRRLRPEHRHARSNVLGPSKQRSHPWRRALSGNYYAKTRTCVTCGHTKFYREFLNYAISTDLRPYDGLNIQCRSCKKTKYRHGYRLDDFIVDEDEETDE